VLFIGTRFSNLYIAVDTPAVIGTQFRERDLLFIDTKFSNLHTAYLMLLLIVSKGAKNRIICGG
jgi:hypothetical protein